jgi:hypothetical protein
MCKFIVILAFILDFTVIKQSTFAGGAGIKLYYRK